MPILNCKIGHFFDILLAENNAMDQLTKLTENLTFEWQNNEFELNPNTMSFLHHWNFGTSTQYYKDKNKFIILPNKSGELVKITDINGALDKALETYNIFTEELMNGNNDE